MPLSVPQINQFHILESFSYNIALAFAPLEQKWESYLEQQTSEAEVLELFFPPFSDVCFSLCVSIIFSHCGWLSLYANKNKMYISGFYLYIVVIPYDN